MNEIEKDGLNVTVRPNKDITGANLNELRDDLILLAGDFKVITVDLSYVEIIDSAGIGLLISTQNALTKLHHSLNVVNVSNDIYVMFKTMHLDNHFNITCK